MRIQSGAGLATALAAGQAITRAPLRLTALEIETAGPHPAQCSHDFTVVQ